MTIADPPFTIGIEEEYLLVDQQTRNLVSAPPAAMIEACQSRIHDLVRPEFLQSQIEVGTRVCRTVQQGREDLAWLRRTVAEVAAEYGCAPIAASTHPFSEWQEQKPTERERYKVIAHDLQAMGRRLVICGLHVHVGIDGDDLRIDLLNQAIYFLPYLLALSTSSPFWRGEDTGLMSYRLSVFDELPRTGLPDTFDSFAEYQRHVDVLRHAGLIKDASLLWSDIRPSVAFPTIEMRICDVCPLLEDTVAIAALFLSILHMLFRLRRNNQRWRLYARMLINENRWRARRYGFDEGLVDFGRGEIVPCADLLDELLELVDPDARELDCLNEVRHARHILERGTSAHRQRRVHAAACKAGADPHEALVAVVDSLIEESTRLNSSHP